MTYAAGRSRRHGDPLSGRATGRRRASSTTSSSRSPPSCAPRSGAAQGRVAHAATRDAGADVVSTMFAIRRPGKHVLVLVNHGADASMPCSRSPRRSMSTTADGNVTTRSTGHPRRRAARSMPVVYT